MKETTHVMEHDHCAVLLDHASAKVFAFSKDEFSVCEIEAADTRGNLHHKAGSVGSGHHHDTHAYFAAIVGELALYREILILGHGTAKLDFARYLQDSEPGLSARVVGIETVDKPTDREIVALAGKHFKARHAHLGGGV